jgi:hypothetical protein
MDVPFSELPGRHERQLRRRLDCRLFPRPLAQLEDEVLLEAQRRDHEELIAFVGDLRNTVGRAAMLEANAASETVLGLKEDLERLYERSAGLAEDQTANKGALRHLIDVIMRSVRLAAGNDPLAQAELDRAEAARALHFEQLEHRIVADLLAPDSPIEADELVPTLLCEAASALPAALLLFDADQLVQLCVDARAVLEARDAGRQRSDACARLAQMEAALGERLAGAPEN